MRRDFRQASFADGLVNQRKGRNEWLDEIDGIIDWSGVVKTLSEIYDSDEGRPSYPILTYVKLLLLQSWYGLSDPGLEEAVDDRLSFRRFAGIPLDETVPDHSSIWRFRQELADRGLSEALFAEVGRQLEARGLLVKKGTLIDATIVDAAVRPPAVSEGTVSERDPEAGWTKKNGKSRFGYKGHLAVDEESGLIRESILTSADVHDSVPAAALIQGDEGAVYGDKAYGSAALRAQLAAAEIKDGLMYKASRGKPLKPWQKAFNKAVSTIRSAAERPFAVLKAGPPGWTRVRFVGLARNQVDLDLKCIGINLRRARVLLA